MLTISQLNTFSTLQGYVYKEMGVSPDGIPEFHFIGADGRVLRFTAEEIKKTIDRRTKCRKS